MTAMHLIVLFMRVCNTQVWLEKDFTTEFPVSA